MPPAEDTEALRERLMNELYEDVQTVDRALAKFQGTERRRAAKPVMEKKLGAGVAKEVAAEQAAEYVGEQLEKTDELLGPVGGAIKATATASGRSMGT